MAGRAGKLKLGKGSAFVKRRLSWLPQQQIVQEADFRPFPVGLCDLDLWLGMVVGDGSVLAQEILEHAPDVNDLGKLLAEAMERPSMEHTRCRPKAIHLRDDPEWEEIHPHLKQLRIQVVVTKELAAWDQATADLLAYLKSREWEQLVDDILEERGPKGGREEHLLELRLATILYLAARRAAKG